MIDRLFPKSINNFVNIQSKSCLSRNNGPLVEHVWFFKKRLLSERVVEFFVWSIHEKRFLLCRVTSAFDQYAYYEKR